MSARDAHALARAIDGRDAPAILGHLLDVYGARATVALSFGAEDMVLVHLLGELAATRGTTLRAFTLDTGRLPEETYRVMEAARARYGITFEVYAPQSSAVEALVRAKGPLSFMDGVEERKECCRVRKVEPLARALADVDVWVTGLRRAQSAARADTALVEVDGAHRGILKVSPLVEWSERAVWDFLAEHRVPVNALHGEGYPSIGCAPCTRAVPGWTKGEGDVVDLRAGRWWWEDESHKECGLHARGGVG